MRLYAIIRCMKKILLVDGLELLQDLEKSFLKRKDFMAFVAESVTEGIAIHRRERVDLIIWSLNAAANVDVEYACRTIRGDKTLKHVSILLITDNASEKEIDRYKSAGANDCISKPFDQIELLKKIGKFTDVPVRVNTRLFVKMRIERITGSNVEQFLGTTVNLSAGGFLIETGHHFNLSETVSFSLGIPDVKKPIFVAGEIMRKAAGQNPSMNYYGVKFIDISKEDKDAIESYVKLHQEAAISSG